MFSYTSVQHVRGLLASSHTLVHRMCKDAMHVLLHLCSECVKDVMHASMHLGAECERHVMHVLIY